MRARRTLFDRRARRPRPDLDDKVLTGWNGLMIAAFARAGRVLADGAALGPHAGSDHASRHLESARSAATFLTGRMWDRDRGVLLRRYRAGQAAIDGYAEDYAYLIWGLLELFSASGDAEWLEWSIDLQRRQDELFWDETSGGWFSTTGADPSVLVRMKEDYDGAEPSASAVGLCNLVALAHLTGDESYQSRTAAVLGAFGTRLLAHGRTLPMMAAGLSAAMAPPEQIVVVDDGSGGAAALWTAAHRRYRPFTQMVRLAPGEKQERLARLMPWAAAMTLQDGKPAAYVCRNFACEAPTTEPESLL
jgi:uncharacterized protein YyaL (SSP411 family)